MALDQGAPAQAPVEPTSSPRIHSIGTEGELRSSPDQQGQGAGTTFGRMRFRLVAILVVGVTVAAGACLVGTGATAAADGASTPLNSIWLTSGSYTPKAPHGATDDYHCTVVDPHVTHSSYIVSSQFFPGSVEDHHAALFLLPPSLVAQARRDEVFKHGWTCFGEGTLPGTPLADFGQTKLLAIGRPVQGPSSFRKGPVMSFRQGAWWSCRSTTTCSPVTRRSRTHWSFTRPRYQHHCCLCMSKRWRRHPTCRVQPESPALCAIERPHSPTRVTASARLPLSRSMGSKPSAVAIHPNHQRETRPRVRHPWIRAATS